MVDAAGYWIKLLEIKLERRKQSSLGRIASATDQFNMYRGMADKSEVAAKKIADAQAVLEELGEADKQQLAAHWDRVDEAKARLKDAQDLAQWLVFPE